MDSARFLETFLRDFAPSCWHDSIMQLLQIFHAVNLPFYKRCTIGLTSGNEKQFVRYSDYQSGTNNHPMVKVTWIIFLFLSYLFDLKSNWISWPSLHVFVFLVFFFIELPGWYPFWWWKRFVVSQILVGTDQWLILQTVSICELRGDCVNKLGVDQKGSAGYCGQSSQRCHISASLCSTCLTAVW